MQLLRRVRRAPTLSASYYDGWMCLPHGFYFYCHGEEHFDCRLWYTARRSMESLVWTPRPSPILTLTGRALSAMERLWLSNHAWKPELFSTDCFTVNSRELGYIRSVLPVEVPLEILEQCLIKEDG